jgi:hypothetical protein
MMESVACCLPIRERACLDSIDRSSEVEYGPATTTTSPRRMYHGWSIGAGLLRAVEQVVGYLIGII